VANGNDGIIWGVTEGFQARPISGLIENVTVAGNSRFGFALDGNGALPAGGALPNFVIKDSLVLNNDDGGLRVVTGAGTQTIEYSAFSGNGDPPSPSDDFVGAAAAGTGTITGTAPIFVNTTDPTSPLYYALDPSTSKLISLGKKNGWKFSRSCRIGTIVEYRFCGSRRVHPRPGRFHQCRRPHVWWCFQCGGRDNQYEIVLE